MACDVGNKSCCVNSKKKLIISMAFRFSLLFHFTYNGVSLLSFQLNRSPCRRAFWLLASKRIQLTFVTGLIWDGKCIAFLKSFESPITCLYTSVIRSFLGTANVEVYCQLHLEVSRNLIHSSLSKDEDNALILCRCLLSYCQLPKHRTKV